jgi:hypothetical protein
MNKPYRTLTQAASLRAEAYRAEREWKNRRKKIVMVGSAVFAGLIGLEIVAIPKANKYEAEQRRINEAAEQAAISQKNAAYKTAIESNQPLRVDVYGNVIPAPCVPTAANMRHCGFDIPEADYQRHVKSDVDQDFASGARTVRQ